MTAPAVALDSAPTNWHLLDEATDHIPGISAERAMKELLAGKTPKRTVLVAIIDSGIDTAHADLRANLWTNPKEIPGNGKDDDNNGYVDDIHGWNFVGGRDGQNVHFDTFEVTREYARCHHGAAADGEPPIADAARCLAIDSTFKNKRQQIERQLPDLRESHDAYELAIPILKQAVGADSLTLEAVRGLRPTTPQVTSARGLYLDHAEWGETPTSVEAALASIEGALKYSLNPEYSSRSIVGDNYADLNDRRYGNNDVMAHGSLHGTHVAGIIGAVRGNGIGVDGIAPAVKIMMIRIAYLQEGDHRDKDLANAIRYAVDNGAHIINLSIGKDYSPHKSAVDDAVRYADEHDVLMVHAAGNDAVDIDRGNKIFPNPAYSDGGRARNWIDVGASSWRGGDRLVAPFSNYGYKGVDVFAPGVDVLSTVPGNQYERKSGTSMAAPVVSGLAALIMDYYPALNARAVKQIILASAARYSNQPVVRPGGGGLVPFAALCATGGIVNAYNAVRMAEEMSRDNQRPEQRTRE